MGEVLHNAPHRQVVVGHIAFAERIAGIGPVTRPVVLWNDHRHEGRHGVPAGHPALPELPDELVDPELVGDRHVVGGVPFRGPVPDRPWQRVIDVVPDALVLEIGVIDPRLEHDAEAEVEKTDPVPLQVVPHGSRLVVILRVDGPGRPGHGIDPGCL